MNRKRDRSQQELVRNTVAGSVAVSTAVGLFNPLDTLRVRWQVRVMMEDERL